MSSIVVCVGCNRPPHPDFVAVEAAEPGEGPRHPDKISAVAAPKKVTIIHEGGGSTVACGTCHATRIPETTSNSGADLDQFHTGLNYAHGSLTCLSCHHADNYDALRLADGTEVPFQNVRILCAQCHGPQYRDYMGGAHGGGAGYWDDRRGPLIRNDCVHCHDPHSPAFPKMIPAFKSHDRFLNSSHPAEGENLEH